MYTRARGFTIVELLVVIVVIGILASISILAFNGIQERAHNTARYHELKAWVKHYELYRATYGAYPAMTTGQSYCLGYGFPVGSDGLARCRDYWQSGWTTSYLESDNAALMAELEKVGSIPGGTRKGIDSSIGPYVTYAAYGIVLRMIIAGDQTGACPSGTTLDYASTTGNYSVCYILLA